MATLTPFLRLYKPITNEVGWDDNMNSNLDIVDSFTRQFMNVPGFVGAWANGVVYAVGNIALDTSSGSMFKCLVGHTAASTGTFAADRTARPTLWVLSNNVLTDSATQAAASATAASNSLITFQNIYYGSSATQPATDPHGGARTIGDLYFDTSQQALGVWTGTAWQFVTPSVPTTGGDFTGDVHFGSRVSITNGFRTTTNAPPGFLLVDQFAARGGIGSNLYISVTPPYTPAAPGWRYTEATLGEGAYVITGFAVTAPGPNLGVRGVLFSAAPTGEAATADGPTVLHTMASMDSNGNFAVTGGGFQPNGGPWFNSLSDARGKTVIGPYSHGLTELLEMVPKLYTYNGNVNAVAPDGSMGDPLVSNTTKQYIGLIAQDCEAYMPEMVMQTSAYIDGVLQTDVRQLDTNALTFALINAVATLDARLKALETR